MRQDVLAIGNAICDILVRIDEDVIGEFKLEKGAMQLVSDLEVNNLLKFLKERKYDFFLKGGGSVANSIYYLSKYNLNNGFVGNLGGDIYAKHFLNEFCDLNIEFFNNSEIDSNKTAKSIILVTKDGERTMCTSLGTAADISFQIIDQEKLLNYKYLLIEGYLWDTQKTREEIFDFSRKLKKQKIVLTLSDRFCVKRNKELFLKFINHKVNIIFGNEGEIIELYGYDYFHLDTAKKIQNNMGSLEIIIVTQNKNGCTIITKEEIINVKTEVKQALDSTGAGDSFLGGFLYGLVKGFSLEKSANIANFIAGKVVTELGARVGVSLPKLNL